MCMCLPQVYSNLPNFFHVFGGSLKGHIPSPMSEYVSDMDTLIKMNFDMEKQGASLFDFLF